MYEDEEGDIADDVTVKISNTTADARPLNTAFTTTKKIQIGKDLAIADAGATSHFVLPGAPVENIQVATNPLEILLPDGDTIKSTHTCTLNIPWLPVAARQAHVVPGLAHTSLVSIKMLCDAGCLVTYDKNECKISYQNRIVWIGHREPSTGLWVLPLGPIQPPPNEPYSPPPPECAANAYTLTSKQQLIQYLHQCLFCPPKLTLLKAIKNNQLTTWPGLTAQAVTKYLPETCPATDKGHMKRHRKGIRSTTDKLDRVEQQRILDTDMHPPQVDERKNYLFFKLGCYNKKNGTVYVDPTGKFPVRSIDGYQVVFILYDWTSNAILATPIKDTTDESMLTAFEDNIEYLSSRGFKPIYNIIDNVASTAIKKYLAKKNIAFQLVEPYNHRANAAERAIQTWKNHFIAGLGVTDQDFPIQLWPHLVQQGTDTLNMLRTSRVYPKLSAYHVLEGTHDFNRHPLAPPGTKATIFNPPETRTSWGPRAIDAWYLGTAKDHYRCLQFYVPTTRRTRVSGQYNLYPQHCQVPIEQPWDTTTKNAQQLLDSISKLRGTKYAPSNRHIEALENLSRIYKAATDKLPADNAPQTNTSGTPTAPATIRQAPRVHLRQTRRNTPGQLPPVPPPHVASPRHTTTTEGRTEGVTGDLLSVETGNNEQSEMETSEGEYTPSNVWYRSLRQPTKPPPVKKRRSTRIRNRKAVVTMAQPTETEFTQQNTIPLSQPALPGQVIFKNASPSYDPPPRTASPRLISQEALYSFIDTATDDRRTEHANFTPKKMRIPSWAKERDLAEFCAPVIHPTTGEIITKYQRLARDKELGQTWQTGFGKEFGSLAQGDTRTGVKGNSTLIVMERNDIKNIPADRKVTYGRLVVDYRPQKEDPNRVRLTAGGNLIDYPGELYTKTADLTTTKLLWNSVISTPGARYMCLDIKNFYLCAPLDRYEYMKMPLSIFPDHIVDQYDLKNKAKNGFVYLEIRRSIYGLPQSGKLANEYLKKKLGPAGFFECTHTPGLWKHVSRPIQFTLVVDDFGVKYVGKDNAEFLLNALKKDFTVSEDWDGALYCGIKLDWNYEEGYVDCSMPGYVKKTLHKYNHPTPTKPQHSPFPIPPKKFGSAAQAPDPEDTSPAATDEEKKEIQRKVGSILYYGRAVDMTTLTALNDIGSQQANPTQNTTRLANHLLDYLATHPNATLRFYASDMILNVHSDASYLSVSKGRSRASGYFFLGTLPRDDQPIQLNGAFHNLCTILPFVAASAAEAELGALFLNMKEARIFRLTLEELGHTQPPTPVHCDNKTTTGIVNGTVKRHRARSMEMRYFYACDQVDNGHFKVLWYPGLENLADYLSKHHDASHHRRVRAIYLHCTDSPRVLPRAKAPSALRGCVENRAGGYVRGRPLPSFPSATDRPLEACAIALDTTNLQDNGQANSFISLLVSKPLRTTI